ncbi:uncharacterized protein FIBRA_08148 [Fibroporia radiculosa]|uniref:Glucose-methanol-choline oxidoreductase N-terminal domain-containing protein n=1 Tax=Fibroporia radiculosa TaxID=599839 RepID=J4GWA7_9APHY|nr:uncharacterized protein FIBRA_08148 [Fibroporia radiculosa]CCM05910.1 predicted protein [Fibroporia radiculosa]
MPNQFEVDVIIAGGGTSGCIIAGRLALADRTLTILVVEAGPPTREELTHIQPVRCFSHGSPDSITLKCYVGKESDDLGGRSPIVPCGRCLGGGSSVNYMMYTRPSPSDYDDWETVYGNPGWSSKDLIPLLKKSETYEIEDGKDTHGYSGPLRVSYGGFFTTWGQEFLSTAAKYDKTRSSTDDPNGMRVGDINAYGRWQKYIGAQNGRRSDIPHHYIFQQDCRNIQIETGYLVKRVIFDGKKAVGIEYSSNPQLRPDAMQEIRIAHARRMVVISAGAFGSPAILERSGIGSKDLLQSLGIETIVDLSGVGENFQDHNVMFVPYHVDQKAETLDGITYVNHSEWTTQWIKDGSGLIAHNGIDAGVKLRPDKNELRKIGPDFQQHWMDYFANAPDKPPMWLGPASFFVGDLSTVPPAKYSTVVYYLNYPRSIGHVHITSASDAAAPPDFDPKYLSHAGDVALLRWAYKLNRELARRMPSYRGEYVPNHPAFPDNSAATCRSDVYPATISDPDIEYTAEDDQAIDVYSRRVVATAWHHLGTCAMKARESGGVVDSNLNVYGVENLKVADMSIAPANVSSNTYSTAIAIGEKAAIILLRDLGIGTC